MTYSHILETINNIHILGNDYLLNEKEKIQKVFLNYTNLDDKTINNLNALDLLITYELEKREGIYETITI